MRIYILKARENLSPNPWSPWYDKAFGFVVCAKNEKEARKLAQKDGGCETSDRKYKDFPAWTDNKYSTCEELIPVNESKIIIKDFAAA